MTAKYFLKCFVQQVSCGMVLHNVFTLLTVYLCPDAIADLQVSGFNSHQVNMLAVRSLEQSCNLSSYGTASQKTGVADLAAALCIERRSFKHNLAFCAFADDINKCAVNHNCQYFRLCYHVSISNKFAFNRQFGKSAALDFHAGVVLAGCSGPVALLLHRCIEAFAVYSKPLLGSKVFCQVKREAVGVIELERVGTCNSTQSVSFSFGRNFTKNGKTVG